MKMEQEVKERISTLWIVVMFCMLYADVLTMHIPEFAQEIVTGTTDVAITEGLMLSFSIFVVFPIAMIFLSRILSDIASRRANITVAVVTAVAIVGGAEFVAHYYFLAAAELVSLSLIVWYAWQLPAAHDMTMATETKETLPSHS